MEPRLHLEFSLFALGLILNIEFPCYTSPDSFSIDEWYITTRAFSGLLLLFT